MPDNLSLDDVVITNNLLVIKDRRVPKPYPGDYLLMWVEPGKAKISFVQVDKVKDKDKLLFVTVEKNRHLPDFREQRQYEMHHVLLNLGQRDPITNSVAGVNHELFIKSERTPVGTLHYFRTMEEREHAGFIKGLKKSYKIMKELRLDSVYPFDWEIRPSSGKFSGFYTKFKADKDGNARQHCITLKPKEWQDITYLLLHEMMHAVDMNLFTVEEKARWIDVYNQGLQIERIEDNRIQNVLTDFLLGGAEYEPANDEDQFIYDEALTFIENKHYLRWRDLEVVLESNRREEVLRRIWPTSADIVQEQLLVTEYAKENAEELIAEALTFYILDRPLPKHIKKLAENTLNAVKSRQTRKGKSR